MSLEHKVMEAFISAVEQVGDEEGKNGIVGFLLTGAKSHPNYLVEILVGGLPYEDPKGDPAKDQFKARTETVGLSRRR